MARMTMEEVELVVMWPDKGEDTFPVWIGAANEMLKCYASSGDKGRGVVTGEDYLLLHAVAVHNALACRSRTVDVMGLSPIIWGLALTAGAFIAAIAILIYNAQ